MTLKRWLVVGIGVAFMAGLVAVPVILGAVTIWQSVGIWAGACAFTALVVGLVGLSVHLWDS